MRFWGNLLTSTDHPLASTDGRLVPTDVPLKPQNGQKRNILQIVARLGGKMELGRYYKGEVSQRVTFFKMSYFAGRLIILCEFKAFPRDMKNRIMYVELKTGYVDNGPAWIGKVYFSKSGRTIYFNGKAFGKGSGISGNHYEIDSGDEYWISGIKKDGYDRHWAGSGKIKIDRSIVAEYLVLINKTELPKNGFEIVDLDNNPPKQLFNEILNRKL